MDNLHNNVSKLWLMDYQVDKVSEAEALATSGDELKLMGSAVVCYQLHDSVPTILELGDSYDGSIKVIV